jgi:hypothetical protein
MSRKTKWPEHVAGMRAKRNAYRILVGKPEGKKPLGRTRHRWIILKWILRAIGWGGMDWIDLAQDRNQWTALMSTVITFGFHVMFGNS